MQHTFENDTGLLCKIVNIKPEVAVQQLMVAVLFTLASTLEWIKIWNDFNCDFKCTERGSDSHKAGRHKPLRAVTPIVLFLTLVWLLGSKSNEILQSDQSLFFTFWVSALFMSIHQFHAFIFG